MRRHRSSEKGISGYIGAYAGLASGKMLEPVLRAQKDSHLDSLSVEEFELPYTIAEDMSYCINVHFAKPSCPKQSSPPLEDTRRATLFLCTS
jgi:hypothetical protein